MYFLCLDLISNQYQTNFYAYFLTVSHRGPVSDFVVCSYCIKLQTSTFTDLSEIYSTDFILLFFFLRVSCQGVLLSTAIVDMTISPLPMAWGGSKYLQLECPKNLKMFKLDLTWSFRSGWTWTWPDLNLLKQDLTWLELEVSNQVFFK